LIVPREGSSPVAIVSSIIRDPMRGTWLEEDKVYSWPAP
jgi:hypothetical protein